ncbi:ATP-binding cassette-type vacuolar membrane transporter Hmt1, partial [Coemansia sp. RSA 2706]
TASNLCARGFIVPALSRIAATMARCLRVHLFAIAVNTADIERHQLLPGYDNPASDSEHESLSTSPTALDIRQPVSTQYPGSKAMRAAASAAANLTSRAEILRQICNALVWLLAAESLVHTMLNFALRQELTRSQRPDTGAIRLSSWLAFAQICIAASWVLQLRHRYIPPSKRRVASVQRPTFLWTADRECFWLLSLIASIYELYAYIVCSLSPTGTHGSLAPLHNTMLRTLIAIRIVINSVLAGCAAHGAYLARRHRKLALHSGRQQQQQQQQPPLQPWPQDVTAGYEAMPCSAAESTRKPLGDSDDEFAAAAGKHNQAHTARQQPPRLCRADTTPGLGTYGATSSSALHTTPSTTSTVSQGEPLETTPLVAGTRRSEHGTGPAHTAVHADDSDDFDTNALKSGAKKMKMYHQSDDLSHDIMGLRQRLRLLAPFLWPSGDRLMQLRIFCCLLILVAGRVVNVLVPLQFKVVVDGLSPKDGSAPRFEWVNVLLYAGLQSMQGSVGILSTMQSFVWIPVGQATTKRISIAMFDHLHRLSLRFHVGRKTGEILRVQDRGVTSVVSLLRSIIFNVIPTLADIALACYFFSV